VVFGKPEYDLYIDVLMHLGEAAAAFEISERRRARALLDILGEGPGLRHDVDPSLLETENVLQRQLNDLEAKRSALEHGDDRQALAVAERSVRELRLKLDEIRGKIRRSSPRYAARPHPQPVSLDEVRDELLDGQTVLLSYSLGDQRSFLWQVSKEGIRSHVLPGREEIETAVLETHHLLRQRSSQAEPKRSLHLARVSEMLLGPVAADLGKVVQQPREPREHRLPEAWWKLFHGAAPVAPGEALFGREEDLEKLLEMIFADGFRCATLWGVNGCGKTSLIRAGLLPELEKTGISPVYIDHYGDLGEDLRRIVAQAAGLDEPRSSFGETLRAAAEDSELLLICDQLGEIYRMQDVHAEAVEHLLREICQCLDDVTLPVRFLLVIEADQMELLLADFDRLSQVWDPLASRFRLRRLPRADAERILAWLATKAGTVWPKALIETAIRDLSHRGRVSPAEVQLLAASLFLRGIETPAQYRSDGGARSLTQGYLDAVLSRLTVNELLAWRMLESLVDPAAPSGRVARTGEALLQAAVASPGAVRQILHALEQSCVIASRTSPETTYELMHDVLVESVLRATQRQGGAPELPAPHGRGAAVALDLHPTSGIPAPPEPYVAHPYTLLRPRRFVGRQRELHRLTDWIVKPEKVNHARVLCIVGLGGMGKSALAWHWFREIAPQELAPWFRGGTPLRGRV